MENRRLILAIALVLFVWSGFNLLFPPEKKAPQEEVVQQQQSTVKAVESTPVRRAEVERPVIEPTSPERRLRLVSDLYELVISTNGARLVQAQLNNFKVENTPDSALVKIIDVANPAYGSFATSGGEGLYLPDNLNYSTDEKSDVINLRNDGPTTITLKAITSENLVIEKAYTFYPESYHFDLDVNITNTSNALLKGSLNTSLVSVWDESKKVDRYNFIGPSTFNGEDVEEESIDDLKKAGKTYSKDTLWSAFTSKYFATIVRPEKSSFKDVKISFHNADEKTEKNIPSITNTFSSPFVNFEPGKTYTFKYYNYLGPRDYDMLKESNLSFEEIIDLGFFGIIAHPLMVALKFFYGFLGNFGVAIILLTVCIKAIFWPLTQKSYSSMKDMQKLQPQMQKLRAKYGKDKQKLNQEMMALYKENRVNPFGGCLPMVIQIPVFFALYQVLLAAIELRHAPFMLWITDLSAPDTLISDLMGLGFALGPLPLIMGFTMFLQQKMTPTNMDPMQAKIMLFMPVFFTFIFLSFPSGLVLYWLVNNLLTIAQQYLINRKPA